MSFTQPFLLWALPLALVPPILHLLSLRRARRETFSDLTLLRSVDAESRPARRLRSWLLALVRAALTACLILAWAGPVVSRDAGAGEAGTGTDLVILLDASYSMGYRVHGRTRLEAAAAAAGAVVRSLGPGDRAAVAVFSDRWEAPAPGPAWAGGKAEALDLLAKATLSHRGTDVCAALAGAHALLAKPGTGERRGRKVVLVLSDGARHGLSCPAPEPEPGVKVLGTTWEDEPSNGWIASAGPADQSSPASPALSVRGLGSGPGAGATQARLFISGSRTGAAGLDLGRSSGDRAVLRLGPARDERRPAWRGWVELTADALSSDDRWYFSFRHGRRPRALCLYGSPGFFRAGQAGYFLKELLGAEQGSLLGWDADFLELSRLAEAPLSDYRVVVIADFGEVPEPVRTALEDFGRSGGGLWVLPGAMTPDSALAGLGRLLPAAAGPLEESSAPFGLTAAGDGRFSEFELSKVAVRRARRLEPRPGSVVVFRRADGAAVMAAGPLGRGGVALWGAPLDLESSNLGLKPAFALWTQRSLEAAASDNEPPTEVLQLGVGAPIALAWREGEPLPSSVKVRSPEGRLSQLYPKGRRVVYEDTSVPGLYSVVEEGRSSRESVYAVNLDRSRESDLTRAGSPPWQRVRAEALEEDLKDALFGTEARGSVLAAAGLLLMLEMLLALPRRGSRVRARLRTGAAAACLLALLPAAPASAQENAPHGDRFVWSQLKLGPDWDPYPEVHKDALELFGRVTSVLVWPERRVLAPEDELLFESPLVVLAGLGAPPDLTERQLRNLRSFVSGGGILWIEDVSGAAASPFDRWVRRRFLPELLPEAELAPLPSDHVVYKTFFFLRGPAGRASVRPALEAVLWDGRAAVLYSRNDILGAWAKDGLGRPLFACVPGGEAQRHQSRKLTLNILMYGLTGSYKADAVHQPFLLQKMRMGVP
ncbi:MAG: DUF4159 domain-containing protein [Elusimicrobia bacterium]|nr:DUF4159 domain-containing protein [Elusimicrobiota bacterium]